MSDEYLNLKKFLEDLQELFDKSIEGIISGDESSNYKFSEELKTKYDKICINDDNLKMDSGNFDFEFDIIKIFENFKKNCLEIKNAGLDSYFCQMLELYEFIFKLYNNDKFRYNQEIENVFLNSKNKINDDKKPYHYDLPEIYISLGRNSQSKLNSFLDELILEVLLNVDPKVLFVSNNLLTFFKNSSSFLTFKIIIAHLIIYSRLSKQNNHKFFCTCLSNVANMIIPESLLFSKKMNLELYDNQFSDFEYNGSQNSKRNLNIEEFNFLKNNFFNIINLIINTLIESNFILIDFTSRNAHMKFLNLLERSIEEKKTKTDEQEEIKIYKCYLIMCFICDILEYVFSNLHYLDETFKLEENSIEIDLNPFLIFKDDIKPRNYTDFLQLVERIIKTICPNFVNLIEIFLKVTDIKNSNEEKIKEIEKESEDSNYFIFESFNPVGFSVLTWIMWKKQKLYMDIDKQNYFPVLYSNKFLLDINLPIIAVLIKRTQNFKFIGMELLFDILSHMNEKVVQDMRLLKHYSFEDVFKDLLQFIGGPDPETKRIYVTKNILKYVKVLTDEAKKEFFLFLLKDHLKENSGGNINDAEVSFIIYTLKNYISEEIRKKDSILKESFNDKQKYLSLPDTIFCEKFLKEIIETSLNEQLFVIDIFETLSQSMNFAHFLIIQDKIHFKGGLNIYNKNYLYHIQKKIGVISNLIEKWVRSNDEEKMKHVRIDTSELNMMTSMSEKREELQKSFELRKNQAMLSLNMVSNLERLISDNLKSISLNP